jgi:hypothetical protein
VAFGDDLSSSRLAQLHRLQDEWLTLGTSCELADRPRAEGAITQLYWLSGMPEPDFVWVDSPTAGDYVSVDAYDTAVELSGENRRWLQDPRLGFLATVRRERLSPAIEQVWGALALSHPSAAWRRDVLLAAAGSFTVPWVAFLDVLTDIGLVSHDREDRERLALFVAAARSCGGWAPEPRVCFIGERPAQVRMEAWTIGDIRPMRLHCPDGPAIMFRDDFGVWAWHGTRVPQRVIEAPERLTAADWLAEGHAEIRRVILERMGGYAKLLEGIPAVKVATDDYGILWRIEAGYGPEPTVLVDVLNSTPEPDGSFRRYLLRVPPQFGERGSSPRDAIGWTFDLEPGKYHPDTMT